MEKELRLRKRFTASEEIRASKEWRALKVVTS